MDRRRRTFALVACLASVSLIAACGNGASSKSKSSAATAATSQSSGDQSTTVASAGPGETGFNAGAPTTTSVTSSGGPNNKTGTPSTTKTIKVTGGTSSGGTGARRPTAPQVGPIAVQQQPPTTVTPGDEPQPGGTATLLLNSEIAGLDPTMVNGAGATDATRAAAVFDNLVFNTSSDGQVHAQLAESVLSTDGVVWNIKVRPGVKFSDGTAFDAAAVKFNWERHQNPANRSVQAGQVASIASMDVTDPQTLRVTLKAQNNQWPRIIGRYIGYIGSPTAIQARGNDFSSNPVGAGPFLLKEWVRDDHATFVRNPSYWNAPRPYLDQVVIKTITDEDQRTNTFLAAAKMGSGSSKLLPHTDAS